MLFVVEDVCAEGVVFDCDFVVVVLVVLAVFICLSVFVESLLEAAQPDNRIVKAVKVMRIALVVAPLFCNNHLSLNTNRVFHCGQVGRYCAFHFR